MKFSADIVIPARSGSLGIKDKNVRSFCGMPLVVRAIHTAKRAHSADRVIVTTDSESYAGLCRSAPDKTIVYVRKDPHEDQGITAHMAYMDKL